MGRQQPHHPVPRLPPRFHIRPHRFCNTVTLRLEQLNSPDIVFARPSNSPINRAPASAAPLSHRIRPQLDLFVTPCELNSPASDIASARCSIVEKSPSWGLSILLFSKPPTGCHNVQAAGHALSLRQRFSGFSNQTPLGCV